MNPEIANDIELVLEYVRENCDHVCTSECRRSGCNCTCGEFHNGSVFEAVDRIEAHLASHQPNHLDDKSLDH
jgi:hypothetical protein